LAATATIAIAIAIAIVVVLVRGCIIKDALVYFFSRSRTWRRSSDCEGQRRKKPTAVGMKGKERKEKIF